jgi:hypothetical protein
VTALVINWGHRRHEPSAGGSIVLDEGDETSSSDEQRQADAGHGGGTGGLWILGRARVLRRRVNICRPGDGGSRSRPRGVSSVPSGGRVDARASPRSAGGLRCGCRGLDGNGRLGGLAGGLGCLETTGHTVSGGALGKIHRVRAAPGLEGVVVRAVVISLARVLLIHVSDVVKMIVQARD